MQSTVQNCYDGARAALNDAAALTWTNTVLLPFFSRAYRKMFDAFSGIANSRVRHTVHFLLPANTTQWVPVANGVTDMAEPEVLSERGAITQGNVTSTSAPASPNPINVLATAHGLGSAGAQVELIIGGVAGTMDPWGRWFATIVDTNNFTLNGSISNGATGTGGTWSTSGENFVDMLPMSRVSDHAVSSSLIDYDWENSVILFRGANVLRQLRLIYNASGTAPTNANTIILVDNCQNFLETATAAYLADSRGWYQRADRLFQQAFGPNGEADSSGGMLRDLIAPTVLEKQKEQFVPKTMRPSKNALVPYWS